MDTIAGVEGYLYVSAVCVVFDYVPPQACKLQCGGLEKLSAFMFVVFLSGFFFHLLLPPFFFFFLCLKNSKEETEQEQQQQLQHTHERMKDEKKETKEGTIGRRALAQ